MIGPLRRGDASRGNHLRALPRAARHRQRLSWNVVWTKIVPRSLVLRSHSPIGEKTAEESTDEQGCIDGTDDREAGDLHSKRVEEHLDENDISKNKSSRGGIGRPSDLVDTEESGHDDNGEDEEAQF
jgi:hypothetical protein